MYLSFLKFTVKKNKYICIFFLSDTSVLEVMEVTDSCAVARPRLSCDQPLLAVVTKASFYLLCYKT